MSCPFVDCDGEELFTTWDHARVLSQLRKWLLMVGLLTGVVDL